MNFAKVDSILNIKPSEWKNYFSKAEVIPILNELALKIRIINFFYIDCKFNKSLEFLINFVRSKPNDLDVLKSFDQVCQAIQHRIISQPAFNKNQVALVMSYVRLLKVVLKLNNQRYLFGPNKISLNAEALRKISTCVLEKAEPISFEFLSIFQKTLKRSFSNIKFLNNYTDLAHTILNLGNSLEKKNNTEFEIACMKLLDSLGSLKHELIIFAKKPEAVYSLSHVIPNINKVKSQLYNQFKPYIHEPRLKAMVYELFLRASYEKKSTFYLARLCNSLAHSSQCQSDYQRFKEKYVCFAGLSHFSIIIEHNNASKTELFESCRVMRDRETKFIDFMRKMKLRPRYPLSRYLLRLSENRHDFFTNVFLYEKDEIQVSRNVDALYFSGGNKQNYLLGTAYSYAKSPSILAHEYIHHLYSLYIQNTKFDLISTEGMAELLANGICYSQGFYQLQQSINDISIFELIKSRKFPYYNAFKWVAYLANKKFSFYQKLLQLLQKNKKDEFNFELDNFIKNKKYIEDFIVWSNLQLDTCATYIQRHPNSLKLENITIYLNDIIKQLDPNISCPIPSIKLVASNASITRKYRMSRPQTQSTKGLMFARNKWQLNSIQPDDLEFPLATETGLIPYAPKDGISNEIVIFLPIKSLLIGCLFGGLNKLCRPNKYLEPLLFALISRGVNNHVLGSFSESESIDNFFLYLSISYVAFFLNRPLTKIIVEKIQNQCMAFLIQSLTWMLFLNPSFLFSENFIQSSIPMFFTQLLNSMVFKMGEKITNNTIDYFHTNFRPKISYLNFFSTHLNKTTSRQDIQDHFQGTKVFNFSKL